MNPVGYGVAAILMSIFVAVVYWLTIAEYPCLAYPTDYFRAYELGEKIESFRSRHGRLPQRSTPNDVAELNLEARQTIDSGSDGFTYSLWVLLEAESDDEDVLILSNMSFDGPWIVYDARRKSVVCGHR